MRSVGAVAFALLAFGALGGTVAQAADIAAMPAKAPAYVVTSQKNWTGFYVGAFGGYHDGKITQSGCVGLCPVDPTMKGGLFGVQVGYDYQLSNNIVVGAFGWLPLSRPKSTTDIGLGITFRADPTVAWAAAARVGYAYDRWLPYVFGGVAYTHVKVTSSFNVTDSNSYVGPVLGLGLEYAITQNISIDFRYMYSSFPKKEYNFGGGPSSYGESSSNYLFAVNYRF